MMYNPPWTLVLAMPPAVLKYGLARSIWLPLQILIVLWCASRLWVLYGGAPGHATRAWYLGLLWMPTVIALNLGQVSPVVLLGLVGFLWSLDRRRDVAAGAYLSLTAVKPQIVTLVWVALALWVIANRRWRVLAGAAASLAGASLAVAWFNPNVFVQYRHLMANTPPTLEFRVSQSCHRVASDDWNRPELAPVHPYVHRHRRRRGPVEPPTSNVGMVERVASSCALLVSADGLWRVGIRFGRAPGPDYRYCGGCGPHRSEIPRRVWRECVPGGLVGGVRDASGPRSASRVRVDDARRPSFLSRPRPRGRRNRGTRTDSRIPSSLTPTCSIGSRAAPTRTTPGRQRVVR